MQSISWDFVSCSEFRFMFAQPQTFDTSTSLGSERVIVVLSFTHLLNSVHCHTVWLDKLSGRLEFWQRWMNITPHGKRSFLVCCGPDWLTGVVLPTRTRRGVGYSAIKRSGTCVVTSWGHVVHQFDLHARHVCASMLTWFCPCCDTPAPALTIAFAYSDLHP